MGLQTSDLMIVVDQANHANIVINTLDARGLYTPDMGDVSQRRTGIAQLGTYRIAAQTEQGYVLSDFAYGTGGAFFSEFERHCRRHEDNRIRAGSVLRDWVLSTK